MAFSLGLSFTQDNNCKNLKLTDTSTWDYSVQVADVTSATVVITAYGETTGTTTDVLSVLQTAKDGTVSITSGSRVVTGTATTFVSDFTSGDSVIIDGNDYEVHAVNSNTSMLLKELALTSASSETIYLIDKEFDLEDNSFGGTAGVAITDGVYRFLYTVVAGGITYTYDVHQLLYCQVECCVNSRLQELGVTMLTDVCDDDVWRDTLKAYSLLKSLQSSGKCGSSTELEAILETIQRYCDYDDDGCSSC